MTDDRRAGAPLGAGLAEEFPGEGGRLFVVATSIGNRDDLSPRARRVLEGCDLVLAEDTRRLFALARELGLRIRKAESFHDHNEGEKEARALALLRQGASVAVVSDAGTPLVADPGFGLVRACRSEGVPVHPVPGPSAPVAALSAAGLPPIPYVFLGFLPRDRAGRVRLFEAFASVPATLAFFERRDRLADVLGEIRGILGPRQAAVCREMTKVHEEFVLFRLEDPEGAPEGLLGEVTVLVGPPETVERTPEEEVLAMVRAADPDARAKDAAKDIQSRARGWSAKEIYALFGKGSARGR